MSAPTIEEMREALKDVFDPELGYNIVDIGLVYVIEYISDGVVKITMTLTTPGCPASDMIQGGVRQRLEEFDDINEVEINLVWEPRWSPQAMSPVAKEHFGIMEEE
ncbi:MAG TPA: metal-sulfur cluster assembly factor [Burkholderiaceae bacterium]|nr:metal-sulfur cluster assembly factor [Burkholderiaceae bacterium]